MKYSIYWTEFHDPFNWIDDRTENREQDYQRGVASILSSLPNSKVICRCEDDYIEVQAHNTFVADTIENAKRYVRDNYSDIKIFSVFDDKHSRVFTEKDYA